MINAVHIDDESRNITLLDGLIKTHFDGQINMIGSASTIFDAYNLILQTKPQLLFLDIELKNGNAFDLLDKLNDTGGITFKIIFITAFNEYAAKAFRANAIDYLLKPISIEELKEAIEKATRQLKHTDINENILGMLKTLKDAKPPHKIGIPVANGLDFIHANTIVKVEAKGSYSIIYTQKNKPLTATKSLSEIEQLIPHPNFIRVHNSWLINTDFLKKYHRGKSGHLEMEDGSIVPVSLRKKGTFLDKI